MKEIDSSILFPIVWVKLATHNGREPILASKIVEQSDQWIPGSWKGSNFENNSFWIRTA
jgi:hypothetical protein